MLTALFAVAVIKMIYRATSGIGHYMIYVLSQNHRFAAPMAFPFLSVKEFNALPLHSFRAHFAPQFVTVLPSQFFVPSRLTNPAISASFNRR